MFIEISLQEHKAKQYETRLLALKAGTSATLFEHVFTAPHLPRHIFVLASPVTIGEVVRRVSLPFPRVIPRHEWGNSLDTVPWTQPRIFPLGSFVKILESGTYCGDLGYVMAIDFTGDESVHAPLSAIIPTPHAVVIAVVPRIRIERSSPKAPVVGEARTLAIQEQIVAAYQAQSRQVEEVVEAMREKVRVASLRQELMKEKDDLVWSHAQSKKEIEKELVDLVARNTKSKKDLEKELRQASSLRSSMIKNELQDLQSEIMSMQQSASERIATEISTYEPQLESIRSRIDAIPSPPDVSRRRRPPQALFDYGSVEKAAPGHCLPFTYTGEDIFEFANDLGSCFDRPAIVTSATTHQPVVGANLQTLWSLDTIVSPLDNESIFFYQGRMFLRGLELVPIYDNRALEVAHPNIQDLEPFIQSQFDQLRINRLFSALHWQHGDKLTYNDDRVTWYYLREVLWKDQTVRARKINPSFGDTNLDDGTSGLDDVNLHLRWTKRAFQVGDSVEVTFGPHKGMSGAITTVTDQMVTILTANFVEVSKAYHSLKDYRLTFCGAVDPLSRFYPKLYNHYVGRQFVCRRHCRCDRR